MILREINQLSSSLVDSFQSLVATQKARQRILLTCIVRAALIVDGGGSGDEDMGER